MGKANTEAFHRQWGQKVDMKSQRNKCVTLSLGCSSEITSKNCIKTPFESDYHDHNITLAGKVCCYWAQSVA